MKKYLIFCLLVACQASTTKNLGEQFTPSNVMTVDNVLNEIEKTSGGKGFNIEGKVAQSCMSEGCWFPIKDKSGKAILLDVKDKKFRVPTNSTGQEVIVLADVRKDSLSEQGVTLEVRGMRFK